MSGVTFEQMRMALTAEAERIGIVQKLLVDADMRKAPDPGYMKQKEIFEATVRLIDIVSTDDVILNRIRQRARDAKTAAGGA